MSLISQESFEWMKVLSVGLERCCTPSVVFQAKCFMLSSIHCVMRPIHSAFCLLIVKMYAVVFEGCLIDVLLVKAVAPGFFCTVLDPELLFLFAFKRSHKVFMCSPKCDYFSWAAGFIWHRNFFFFLLCIQSKREELWMQHATWPLLFSKPHQESY